MKQSKKYDLRDLEFEDDQIEETVSTSKVEPNDSTIEDGFVRTQRKQKENFFLNFLKRKEVIIGLGACFILIFTLGIIVNSTEKSHPINKDENRIALASKKVLNKSSSSSSRAKNGKTKEVNTPNKIKRPSAFPVGGASSQPTPSNAEPVTQTQSPASNQEVRTTTIKNNQSDVSNSTSETSGTLQLSTRSDNSPNPTPTPMISYVRIDLIPYIGQDIAEVVQYLTGQGATVIVHYQIDKTHPSGTILDVTTQNSTTAVFTVSQ